VRFFLGFVVTEWPFSVSWERFFPDDDMVIQFRFSQKLWEVTKNSSVPRSMPARPYRRLRSFTVDILRLKGRQAHQDASSCSPIYFICTKLRSIY
jgi:hypothetical protein